MGLYIKGTGRSSGGTKYIVGLKIGSSSSKKQIRSLIYLCHTHTLLAEMGKLSTVTWLLTHRAEVNPKDAEGFTPLCSAAARGHSEIVILLLKHEADMTIQTNRGEDEEKYNRP